MRVELRLAGVIARVACTPFERRTGNITWAPRGRRLPASFTVPPGATVSLSVHLLVHFTQLTCGARARASAAPGATESSTTDSTADVPAKRIPAANNRIGARFGGRQLADSAARRGGYPYPRLGCRLHVWRAPALGVSPDAQPPPHPAPARRTPSSSGRRPRRTRGRICSSRLHSGNHLRRSHISACRLRERPGDRGALRAALAEPGRHARGRDDAARGRN